MADVRSLLRNERAARRITHPHATYSTTGTLVCLVCHIQLKSESLWDGHLRSGQHAMRLQRIRDGTLGRPPGAPAPAAQIANSDSEEAERNTPPTTSSNTNGSNGIQGKKRKADDRDDHEEEDDRKRSKSGALPKDFFDDGIQTKSEEPAVKDDTDAEAPVLPLKQSKIESATPQAPAIDEDEWAAFEADIAATEAPVAEDAVISAPAMSAEELAAKARENESEQRKEREQEEMEGDKEDAARQLDEEFEEMRELEEKVKKLKEKREALRTKSFTDGVKPQLVQPPQIDSGAVDEDQDEEDEDDFDDEDDDWDGFRLKV